MVAFTCGECLNGIHTVDFLIWRAVPLCSTNFPVCANTRSTGCVKFLSKGSLLPQPYRRGEVSSPALVSASRKAQNTQNTLKEEVFSAYSAFSVGSVIQTKIRAGNPAPTQQCQKFYTPSFFYGVYDEYLPYFCYNLITKLNEI